MTASARTCVGAAILTVAACAAMAQEIPPPPPYTPAIPNFAGLAFGSAPQHFGADERMAGLVPIVRLQRDDGPQTAALFGVVFTSNILDHPILRSGPTGIYRLGRGDVDDDVVARLPEIDPSVDIGWTIGAEFIDPGNLARRFRIDANVRQDVTGGHGGYVAGAALSGWTPTPFALLGAFVSGTWGSEAYMKTYFGVGARGAAASGLPVFDADAGQRDVSAGLIAIVPVNERLLVGAGVFYGQMLGDAADSPIVADRGSAGQLIYGAGFAVAF